MRTLTLMISILLLFAFTIPASGENFGAPVCETPEALAQSCINSLQTGDFVAFATLLHPEEIELFTDIIDIASSMDSTGSVTMMLFHVDSPDDFATMDKEELIGNFLRVMMDQQQGILESFRTATFTLLGSVPEKDMVHVLYRMSFVIQGIPFETVDIITARQYENTWRMELDAEIKGALEVLKTKLSNN